MKYVVEDFYFQKLSYAALEFELLTSLSLVVDAESEQTKATFWSQLKNWIVGVLYMAV